jgi:hypothetical protein
VALVDASDPDRHRRPFRVLGIEPVESNTHRVGPPLGQLYASRVGILSQTAGPTSECWANPVDFRFRARGGGGWRGAGGAVSDGGGGAGLADVEARAAL